MQCFFIPKNSSLPDDFNDISDGIADNCLSTVKLSAKDIEKSFKILIQTKPMDMIT